MRVNEVPGPELPAGVGLAPWLPRFICHEMSVVGLLGWAGAWRQHKRCVARCGAEKLEPCLELAQSCVLRLCLAGRGTWAVHK